MAGDGLTIEELARELGGGRERKTSNGWASLCPAHPDSKPSLAITVGDKQAVVVKCRVGCSQDAVLAALAARGLSLNGHKEVQPKPRKLERTLRYEIKDLDGRLIATHIRKEFDDGTKDMPWERDGKPGLGGMPLSSLPLYGSERLRDLPPSTGAVVCEGEKPTEALWKRGFHAVGTVCGAAVTPDDAVLAVLKPFRVLLWADNDDSGRAHMAKIAQRLGLNNPPMVSWRGAEWHDDAADYPGTNEELRVMLNWYVKQAEQTDQIEIEPGDDKAPDKPADGDDHPFPVLDPAALHGLAGEYTELADPYTEADKVAVLATLLSSFGNVCGRGIYKMVDGMVRHYMCIWTVLVGLTSKSRKGTSANIGRRPIAMLEPEWVRTCLCRGIGSGEGIINRIHDPIEGKDKEGSPTIIHPGHTDKRLMVFEEEFAGLIQVAQRHGNIASMILRQGWDGVTLQNMVKNSPLIATDPHMSVMAHITRDELIRNIGATEAANGFANRFVWVAVRRSKELPEGGYLGEEHLSKLVQNLIKARDLARRDERMEWSPAAREKWIAGYSWLSRERKGLMGAILSRAEAQVTRLALTYAALDRAPSIGLEHLNAALALWKYSEDSAGWIFGNAIGDPTADTILLALRRTPGGMTRTDIRDLFSRNLTQEKIELALRLLLTSGLVTRTKQETGGRPTERWMAT